jgi:hypothetical protein
MRRWPQFTIPDDWDVLFGPGSGCLRVVPAMRAMATLARQSGVSLLENAPVLGTPTSSSTGTRRMRG